MQNERLLERITVDSKVMVGKPVIRGTRIPVALILKMPLATATTGSIHRNLRSLALPRPRNHFPPPGGTGRRIGPPPESILLILISCQKNNMRRVLSWK